ncbi:carboxypeptidase A6 [Arapaima gigas]
MGSQGSVGRALLLAVVVLCGIVRGPGAAHLYNNRYAGDQVIRVSPQSDKDVQVIKRLFEKLKDVTVVDTGSSLNWYQDIDSTDM